MAELRSEEEQLDVIKRWWKENGTSLIAGAVIAAAGVFGWHAWQDYQEGQAAAASVRYQQLLTIANLPEQGAEQLDSAKQLVNELNDDYGSTLYAELGLLLEARLAVGQNDLDGAREALERAADGASRDYVKSLAWLRLARIEIAQGNPEQALELLDEPIVDALAAQRLDVRGDAYAALGDRDNARKAWQEALAADGQSQSLYGIQFKLDDLGAEEATS
ncbi:tetratricopeptide repeat protein [Halomonas sp. PAMB 3232]|uniref:YfgM family protein n=1 Tax=Halomonas sp. PAMB 3232 TaxID=3075221 RepID=UPI0028977ACC|nr:tetratricopeptide repeat protein [Halomonas sp. PAMB 3232]WNL39615.1 tetratricopeptide repeat protein [Halomonas sp. PAMB 3232]